MQKSTSKVKFSASCMLLVSVSALFINNGSVLDPGIFLSLVRQNKPHPKNVETKRT